jgi:beta-ketoacyl-acyl-carrier-protein synthase II
MSRVAITGLGVVSPLGNSTDTMFGGLTAGLSGICRLEDHAYVRLSNRIAASVAFDGASHFDAPKLRMLDRVSQFALVAAQQAINDAKLVFNESTKTSTGVFVGTGMGGAQTTDETYHTLYGEQSDRIKPFSVLLAMNNAAASWICLEHGISGPSLTYTTACSSSAVAIGEAARRIKSGEMDVMIAGGSEAPLWPGPMKAWEALRTLASEDSADPSASCKPFSKDRSGMVLGEGAAFVVLENWAKAHARGAKIHAELVGFGITTDSLHLTRPSVNGQARAMDLALASAEISPASVGYLNAHGTGTTANDPIETNAIKKVFADHAYRLPISSTKAMHGHLLGAAGALEFVISVLTLTTGTIAPTRNLAIPDPECDLDYVPNQARQVEVIDVVMSNSFAFGGTNAVLVARRS